MKNRVSRTFTIVMPSLESMTLMVVILLSNYSCISQPQHLGEGILEIEKLQFNEFKADTFFEKVLGTDEEFAGYRKEVIAPNGYTMDPNEKDTLGYLYNMYYSKTEQKLASFHKLFFSEIEAIITLEGELMALQSYASYNDSLAINKTMYTLNKKFGNAEVYKDDFFGEITCRTWYNNDEIIQLVTNIRYIPVFYTIKDENNNETVVTEHEPKTLTRLFITNKKYTEKIRGKLNQGGWLYFK